MSRVGVAQSAIAPKVVVLLVVDICVLVLVVMLVTVEVV